MSRLIILGVAVMFLAGFAFLTFASVADRGFTLGSLVSILVLVLLAVGIVGALLNPPRNPPGR